jgi:uncharacterized protein
LLAEIHKLWGILKTPYKGNFQYFRHPFQNKNKHHHSMSFLPYAQSVAATLQLKTNDVTTVLELLAEGATIPFIARYRKDKTGNLDEVQIQAIEDTAKLQKEFAERKAFIEKTITEQGKMTEALKAKINAALTITVLEDIYLPYKPKRKAKAQTARENGLEPLALKIFAQANFDPMEAAKAFVTELVKSPEDALQGARDIMAEMVNEDANARAKMRKFFEDTATVQSKVLADKELEAAKFKDYFEFSEPISKIPSHRMLAILRGFMEGFLKMDIAPIEEVALEKLEAQFIQHQNATNEHLKKAIKDAYRRLLQPSLESEFRMALKTKADEEAINVFAENLRQLLLSSPVGSKKILAIDPGYRTGCKVVCLDETGALKKTELIYIHEKNNKLLDAEHKIRSLVQQYGIEAFAIGDGTAGRETEQFIRNIDILPKEIPVIVVSEAGASVYSASEVAREEFAAYDLTVRGAVSIGRRLADPLAELVKIDAKSIGVGQYQHDVDQNQLKSKLDEVVGGCVNAVGVELNTASKQLLSYVSGIGPALAQNIVDYRNEHGEFKSRKALKEVPRMGEKVFELCAGFLRVKNGVHPLDKSAVHPESYFIVEKMATDLNCSIDELIDNKDLRKQIQLPKYVTETIGLPTLKDILLELEKPGRDPRKSFEVFSFDENVHAISDLHEGMRLPGIVTNVTNFGAFVDIGVHQDGLVHISQLADEFVDDPNKIVKVGQTVWVNVSEVDVKRKRIALTMKGETQTVKQSKPKVAKEEVYDPNDINSALAALKNKFKK